MIRSFKGRAWDGEALPDFETTLVNSDSSSPKTNSPDANVRQISGMTPAPKAGTGHVTQVKQSTTSIGERVMETVKSKDFWKDTAIIAGIASLIFGGGLAAISIIKRWFRPKPRRRIHARSWNMYNLV